jgi:GNAT superfamily N-acetyltransferase
MLPDTLSVERANSDHAHVLLDLFQQCTRDMIERQGLVNWRSWLENSPAWMREQIASMEMYTVLSNHQLVATFSFQYEPMRYYDMSLWQRPDQDALYLRRLAVLPIEQRHGIGAWCVQRFEQMAVEKGFRTVRFDAYYRAEKLLAFYTRLGYERRGLITIKDDQSVVCFEKGLD